MLRRRVWAMVVSEVQGVLAGAGVELGKRGLCGPAFSQRGTLSSCAVRNCPKGALRPMSLNSGFVRVARNSPTNLVYRPTVAFSSRSMNLCPPCVVRFTVLGCNLLSPEMPHRRF